MNTKQQQIERLSKALVKVRDWDSSRVDDPFNFYCLLRAVVKATIPGRQSAKNAAASMEAAVKAACRTIRRFK